VQVCCIRYADSINTANSNAIGHVSLENWAKSVYQQPSQIAAQVQPFAVMDPAVQAAGVDANGLALIDDAGLQAATEAVVNKTI
jgi:hypothetical protein